MSWTTCPLVQLFAVRWRSSHCWLNNIQYSICNIARVRHCSHEDSMNQRIFFDSLLWITNVWNQSWIISSPFFVPPFDDEPATQRHFPSEAVFFMSMTGQLFDAKLFFVSMILWCRVSQLACKHWQVWPPSMRSCAHPESDSDWCERCVKCSLYTIWLHLCTYVQYTLVQLHWRFTAMENIKRVEKRRRVQLSWNLEDFLTTVTHTHQNM